MRRVIQGLAVAMVFVTGALCAPAQDPGKQVIGTLRAELIFGSEEDPSKARVQGSPLAAEELRRLQASERLKFAHYRVLGADTKPVWKAFENWAVPLKPSENIMVSFEAKGVHEDTLRLDLKLWQQKREVLTALPVLRKGKKLYILGPGWRGGRLIIAVELLELAGK